MAFWSEKKEGRSLKAIIVTVLLYANTHMTDERCPLIQGSEETDLGILRLYIPVPSEMKMSLLYKVTS